MAKRWTIYALIAFLALTVIPISLVAANVYVSPWLLIAGHAGVMIFGFMCAELARYED
ncbi:hypothetical protein HVX64_07040 [Citrobacter sp. RHB20-C16]|uniref:hypothetical protein n=1 Tax=Citrobacter TaxID=544 RepID=UPI0015EA45D4|nr:MULTISPECIES: hypothetical protein [Citrobacter]EHO4073540.1 hypothetical protein [Salmonella enterica subsp. enterica serovar Bareilly]EIK7095362.1 hypothetical protein [Escherichia coli]EKI9078999.1 hypothetical protein [Salmonella enterica subsp. enterica serovar Bareilly]EKJ4771580.1 hypothetical protein [Salmonella enterica subsp. enterica serovar Bareilly]QMK77583.1 hypothetical protein HVX64_07040 [Citrobacter sp. RHB20-C16]